VGLCTDGFEVLIEGLNHKSVYFTALLVVEKKGLRKTVEINVEWNRQQISSW